MTGTTTTTGRRSISIAVLRLALLSTGVLATTAAHAATYTVDPSHTSVTFRVRHLFTSVTGRFTTFEGRIAFDDGAPLATTVQVTIEVASINTDNQKRDDHLRSPDFFDAVKYPKMAFTTSKVTDVNMTNKTAKLHGTLSMHGVERPVVIEAAFLGSGKDPWDNERAGFRATTTVDRKDFGLTWNKALETGGVLVGDTIEIQIDVEAIKAK